jgi:hypothetical protein
MSDENRGGHGLSIIVEFPNGNRIVILGDRILASELKQTMYPRELRMVADLSRLVTEADKEYYSVPKKQ